VLEGGEVDGDEDDRPDAAEGCRRLPRGKKGADDGPGNGKQEKGVAGKVVVDPEERGQGQGGLAERGLYRDR